MATRNPSATGAPRPARGRRPTAASKTAATKAREPVPVITEDFIDPKPDNVAHFPRPETKEELAERERQKVVQYKDAIIADAIRWDDEIKETKADLDTAKMKHASAFKELQKDPKHHEKAFKHARMLLGLYNIKETKFTEFQRMVGIYLEAFGLDKVQVLPLEDAVTPIV